MRHPANLSSANLASKHAWGACVEITHLQSSRCVGSVALDVRLNR